MARISAPVFAFGDHEPVDLSDEYVRMGAAGSELVLSGPSVRPDGRTLPVRGDLAHIRLAGIHFVPHYAVPMPHVAGPDGAMVRAGEAADAESLAVLKPGERFDVLDMSGGCAWGEVIGAAGPGPVGYVTLTQIVATPL
jgi:hypothetical protein